MLSIIPVFDFELKIGDRRCSARDVHTALLRVFDGGKSQMNDLAETAAALVEAGALVKKKSFFYAGPQYDEFSEEFDNLWESVGDPLVHADRILLQLVKNYAQMHGHLSLCYLMSAVSSACERMASEPAAKNAPWVVSDIWDKYAAALKQACKELGVTQQHAAEPIVEMPFVYFGK